MFDGTRIREKFDPTIRLMPRPKRGNPERNVRFCRRVTRREVLKHGDQLVGLEQFSLVKREKKRKKKKKKEKKKKKALGSGVKARKQTQGQN